MNPFEARATWLTAHLLGEMALVWGASDGSCDPARIASEVLAQMEDEIRELGRMAGAVVPDDE